MNDTPPEARPRDVEGPRLIDFKGDLLTATTRTPLPQGMRVDFSLRLEKQNQTVSIMGKVVSIVPVGDDLFNVTIRCHSLKKDERRAVTDEIIAQCPTNATSKPKET
jgi:hypothetical protein